MTDEQLVQQFQKGDPSAFNELVRRHQQTVYGVCRRFLGNDHDADDAAQEVFVKAFNTLHRFTAKARVSTWLYRIAVNHSLNVLRSRRRNNRLQFFSQLSSDDLHLVHHLTDDEPNRRLEQDERTERVQRALAQLNDDLRSVVILHRYEELSYQEIAEVLGVSVRAVESRLFRAKQKLAKLLRSKP